jgi:hypothetical protein
MTLEGARQRLRENPAGESHDQQVIDRLLGIRALLVEIRQELGGDASAEVYRADIGTDEPAEEGFAPSEREFSGADEASFFAGDTSDDRFDEGVEVGTSDYDHAENTFGEVLAGETDPAGNALDEGPTDSLESAFGEVLAEETDPADNAFERGFFADGSSATDAVDAEKPDPAPRVVIEQTLF